MKNDTRPVHQDIDYQRDLATETVGARTHKSLLRDPATPVETLRKLAKDYPLAVLANVNCSPGLFRELAKSHPLEAERSPALDLLLLENPAFWVEIVRQNARDWVNLYVSEESPRPLSERDRRLFATDCAEHILP